MKMTFHDPPTATDINWNSSTSAKKTAITRTGAYGLNY